jgi:YtxH-like protein
VATILLERRARRRDAHELAEEILMNDRTPGCVSPLSSLFYFVAGSVAGAGVALLMAPQSGRATREMVRRRLRDTAGSTRQLKDRLIDRGRSIRDEATHRVDGAVSALAGNGDADLG